MSLEPLKEITTVDGYRMFVYSKEQTSIPMMGLEDPETGMVITTTNADPTKRTASYEAWGGARQSRSPGTPWEIFAEMGDQGVDPDVKLDDTFTGYGHASVGDLPSVIIGFAKIPIHLCYSLFENSPVHAGQEKSTRYQARFGLASIHPLENYLPPDLRAHPDEVKDIVEQYQALGALALSLYEKHKALAEANFTDYFKPSDKAERDAMQTRVKDTARFFLPFGTSSGMAIGTSAREWSRIIGVLRASPVPYYRRAAANMERLLTPTREEEAELNFEAEVPSLIRHTETADLVNNNLADLFASLEMGQGLDNIVNKEFRGEVDQRVRVISREYTEGDKMVAQYLATLYPGADITSLLQWAYTREKMTKIMLGEKIFRGHDNHRELPSFARVTGMSATMEASLGDVRDFIRHRSLGRFTSLPLLFGRSWTRGVAEQVIDHGFVLPKYLTEVPDFASWRGEFSSDLKRYFDQVYELLEKVADGANMEQSHEFVVNLLLQASAVNLTLHGDPKSWHYFTNQRVRPGGHINYRTLAWDINEVFSGYDPYLAHMKLSTSRPNPGNRAEFFDRT